jgi:hypothetical protein
MTDAVPEGMEQRALFLRLINEALGPHLPAPVAALLRTVQTGELPTAPPVPDVPWDLATWAAELPCEQAHALTTDLGAVGDLFTNVAGVVGLLHLRAHRGITPPKNGLVS